MPAWFGGSAEEWMSLGAQGRQTAWNAFEAECQSCNDLGYRVVGGAKKECPNCGPAARFANAIDGAEWVGE